MMPKLKISFPELLPWKMRFIMILLATVAALPARIGWAANEGTGTVVITAPTPPVTVEARHDFSSQPFVLQYTESGDADELILRVIPPDGWTRGSGISQTLTNGTATGAWLADGFTYQITATAVLTNDGQRMVVDVSFAGVAQAYVPPAGTTVSFPVFSDPDPASGPGPRLVTPAVTVSLTPDLDATRFTAALAPQNEGSQWEPFFRGVDLNGPPTEVLFNLFLRERYGNWVSDGTTVALAPVGASPVSGTLGGTTSSGVIGGSIRLPDEGVGAVDPGLAATNVTAGGETIGQLVTPIFGAPSIWSATTDIPRGVGGLTFTEDSASPSNLWMAFSSDYGIADNQYHDVWVRRSTDGGISWSAPVDLSVPARSATDTFADVNPTFAVFSRSGGVHRLFVFWERRYHAGTAPDGTIVFRFYDVAAGSWTPALTSPPATAASGTAAYVLAQPAAAQTAGLNVLDLFFLRHQKGNFSPLWNLVRKRADDPSNSTADSIFLDKTTITDTMDTVPTKKTVIHPQCATVTEPVSGNDITALAFLQHQSRWRANTVYQAGALVSPTSAYLQRLHLLYVAAIGGTSSAAEPTWPTTVGSTVNDGSVVWQCLERRQLDYLYLRPSSTVGAWNTNAEPVLLHENISTGLTQRSQGGFGLFRENTAERNYWLFENRVLSENPPSNTIFYRYALAGSDFTVRSNWNPNGQTNAPSQFSVDDLSLWARSWSASTAFSANEFVRPTTPNGIIYQAAAGGTTGTTEPTWPITAGTSVNDGSVTWRNYSGPVAPAEESQVTAMKDSRGVYWLGWTTQRSANTRGFNLAVKPMLDSFRVVELTGSANQDDGISATDRVLTLGDGSGIATISRPRAGDPENVITRRFRVISRNGVNRLCDLPLLGLKVQVTAGADNAANLERDMTNGATVLTDPVFTFAQGTLPQGQHFNATTRIIDVIDPNNATPEENSVDILVQLTVDNTIDPGVYTGTLVVFKDLNNNDVRDANEPQDVLTIRADVRDLRIAACTAHNTNVTVTFSKPVARADATTRANYVLESPTGTNIDLTGATLTYDDATRTVTITGLNLNPGDTYTVRVGNLRDLGGNAIVANGADNVCTGAVQ
ncbi:MAG: hypothetical protein AUJ92_21815 [Armatimonadetes bacterium CG2_30_59_28]|nr:MAG: hypothetical protein AUJ92_21815 [Armatimonadetes bacterium CG2_30_59_28]PIU62690.1 MAG: hypothetical protein COS85_17820 [Armatimonadetes bacterium CG07_land_8_20_14_0_80_59_28]PIX46013.1 MAG: hypothetical protein COZ56_00550 [Armatimonadetes bacterium CG_4_8_14_3_um_filter_58_9]PJB64629.1 MAG: hypothetical protein CO095_14760 [Armatimonadetes bacterium CG_4_9_14_3_um_filter_58_7]